MKCSTVPPLVTMQRLRFLLQMFNALMDINANTNTVELNKQDEYNKHQSRIQLHGKKHAYDFKLLNEQKIHQHTTFACL